METIQEVAQRIRLNPDLEIPSNDVFKRLAEITNPKKAKAPIIQHAHGMNGFDCCLYCEQEINEDNPGKMVFFDNRIEHICDIDFADPDYQKIIRREGAEAEEFTENKIGKSISIIDSAAQRIQEITNTF